jgi:aryl-alcohol dehydrogenase-like predicted oxidoreductase
VLIGLSLSGPRQAEVLERARTVRVGGAPLFGCVQATWNVLERSCERALAEAHRAGVGVIVKEALANGRLARRPPAPLSEAAATSGTTPAALALAAALAQPWADVVLSGAATIPQLTDNVAATSIAIEPQTLRRLEAMAEDPVRYWTERAALPWN